MSAFAPTQLISQRLGHTWSERRRWPLVSAAGGALAAGIVLLPLAFLIVQAQHSGWGEVQRLLLRHSVAVLLWNTVRLAGVGTVLCAGIGTGAAWLIERTDVPLRRVWG